MLVRYSFWDKSPLQCKTRPDMQYWRRSELSWLRGHTISAGEFSHRTCTQLKYVMWRREGRKEDTNSGRMWEIRSEALVESGVPRT